MEQRGTRKFVKGIKNANKSAEERLADIETSEYSKIRMIHYTAHILDAEVLNVGATYTSADMRALTSPLARGILGTFLIAANASAISLYFGDADDTPDTYSQRYRSSASTAHSSQFVMIPVNAEGKFKIIADAGNGASATMTLELIGWWE